MRLAGFVHSSVVTGGEQVYVPLDALSVLLGPNDSGKTRTLAALYDALASLAEDPDPTPLTVPAYDAELFLELNFEDLISACSRALSALIEEETAPARAFGNRTLHFDPAWYEEIDAAGAIGDDFALPTWLELMRRAADLTDAEWDPLFDALKHSDLVVVVPDTPPIVHLALGADTAKAVGAERLGCAVDGHWPVAVAPLGALPAVQLEPIWLPKRPEAIHERLASGLLLTVEAARAIDGDEPAFDQDPWKAHLIAAGDRVRVSPHFPALCGVAQMIVNEGLPGFVTERYWVTIRPAPIASWAADSTVELLIESRDGARRFPLADAAEGLQLWLQLALLEGVAVLSRLTKALYGAWLGDEDGLPGRDGCRDKLERLGRLTSRPFETDPFFRAAALELLQEVTPEQFEVYRHPHATLQELLDRGLDVEALFGGYVYFVDEPERHLHPAVAREAADWLAREMIERSAQCVLTTHSVPFLNLGDEASYTYLVRVGDRVTGIPLDVDELSALDVLAEEMGFDRGELLTLTRALLFVEGRADQAVLEGLFGRELRRVGVRVIPVQGTGRLHRMIDAEVLFRVTAVPIHVLLDNDVAGDWPRLRADADALEHALRDKKNTELQAVAQLLKTARVHERENDIALMSIPAPDMFFMLDDGILRELYDAYPGHEQAEREWAEQPLGRKRFRGERYGVPDEVGLYARVASMMRERGIIPDALADVLQRLGG